MPSGRGAPEPPVAVQPGPAVLSVDDLPVRMAAFIAAMEPSAGAPVVSGVSRSDIGYSRENWMFDVTWEAEGTRVKRQMIMRRDPMGSVLDTDRRTEYDLLKALEGSAIPAPRACWLDGDGRWFGRPSLVMDRIEGECQMFAIEGPAPLADRLRLAGDCLALLASLHRLDWPTMGLGPILGEDGTGGAGREVAYWRDQMRKQQMGSSPRLDELAEWLAGNLPSPQAQVLVHGDFKPGNMLLKEGRIVALLDWETAHIGDPIEDLGWVTNPLRHREHQIPGVWETSRIVDRYRELTGFEVKPADLVFWNVLANFKLSTIVLTGMRSYAEGRSDRPFEFPTPLVDLAFELIEKG